MNWQDYIHSDPGIVGGKPVVKGTRLSVEFILERLASMFNKVCQVMIY